VARKNAERRGAGRGGGDILGIALICAALLLLAALVSYDRHDLLSNYAPADPAQHLVRNWIGGFGAALADGCFKAFGAAAYLLSVLFLGFGLAQFVPLLGYLRRRWPWALALLLTCAAALDLGTNPAALERLARHPATADAGLLERVSLNLSASGAGGFVGLLLNRNVFAYFGTLGAAILFAAFWIVCLYGLTNFHFGDWVRGLLRQRAAAAETFAGDRENLDRRARGLEKEARRLQEQIDRAGRTGGITGRARSGYRAGLCAYAGCAAGDSPTGGLESGDGQVPRCHVAGTASHGPSLPEHPHGQGGAQRSWGRGH